MKKLFWTLLCAVCICLGVMTPAQAGMISLEDEIKMGRQTAQQLEAEYGLVQDEALQARVDQIGQRLAAVCGRDELTYSFKVLNNPEVNALACPGGFVYVFKGLVDYMPSDTELAGVIGHEVGHVAEKHTVHAIEKQMWTSLALILATKGESLDLLSMAQQVIFAGYSRTDERGADKQGFYNTVKAGYNPYSMLLTLYKLDDLAKEQGNTSYGIFASHPDPEARIKRIEKLVKKLDIHPEVSVQEDGTAIVSEGDWRFNISQSIGNTKAEYRAYMLAGSLWVVSQRGRINPHYFVVHDHGSSADLYYDDVQLLTLYTQDAGAFGSAGAYAAACTELLQEWAEQANQKETRHKKHK